MATWIKQISSSLRERKDFYLAITEREIDLILHGVDTERERSESDEMGFY